MFKLMKIGGTLIGSCAILGVLNGKFNKNNKIHFPKYNEKDYDEKMKASNELICPKLSIARSNRDEHIKNLINSQFDVLVIGGGSTGAGVLFNLYNKGFNSALIESRDFASGTSSRSTKLAHGGVRYLEEVFQFKNDAFDKYKLVVEALTERDFFLNSSPHLNDIVEIKIPVSGIFKLLYYFSGVLIYHFLYFFKTLPNVFYSVPGPKIYLEKLDFKSKKNDLSLSNKFNYFVSLHEGQMFDSRQNLLSLLTTTIDNYNDLSKGTTIANYVEFQEFLYDKDNKIIGVKALDNINNKKIEIKSKLVINCAGVMADNLFSKEDPQFNKIIKASKGSHIIMKKNIFNIESGLMIPRTTDNRIIFILPYQGYYLVGTTDIISKKTDFISPDDSEINYIINELKIYFNIDESEIRNNISAQWSGLRPLFEETHLDNQDSKSISRGHIIKLKENGLISIFGGKWTTYRKIGQDLVDFIEKEKLIENPNSGNSTLNTKLYGSYHVDNIDRNLSYNDEKQILENYKNYLQLKYLIDKPIIDKLVFYYGYNASKVLDLGVSTKSNNKLIESYPILESQIIYSIRHEMAVKPNDIICRRIGIGFLDEQLSNSILEKITNIMGKELNWSSSRIKKEILEAQINMKYLL